MKDNLFYELIRVAIGNADSLSHVPSNEEWEKIYEMAEKQSLVGVCFAGIQRLGADVDRDFTRIGMSEHLYVNWMGMAVNIYQRNEVMNHRCIALQKRLGAEGMRSCILKGQGAGQLYSEHLYGLRQSGDIDVWIGGTRKKTLAYVQRLSPTNKVTRLHVQLKIFNDTEVEVHFTPSYMRCPWLNVRLQKWFKKYENFEQFVPKQGIIVPTDDFNHVFLLLHILRHFLGEGVGLRQIMDYYFLLQASHENSAILTQNRIIKLLKQFRLYRFAKGMMWVMYEVFGLKRECMLCDPDEKLGRLILREIEQGGNFGHYDKRSKKNESAWMRFFRTNASNLKYIRYFPEEVLCTPFYRAWHRCWQKKHGYRG